MPVALLLTFVCSGSTRQVTGRTACQSWGESVNGGTPHQQGNPARGEAEYRSHGRPGTTERNPARVRCSVAIRVVMPAGTSSAETRSHTVNRPRPATGNRTRVAAARTIRAAR